MKPFTLCTAMLFVTLLFLYGCSQKPYNKQFYAFQPPVHASQAQPDYGTCEVRSFSVDAPYGTKAFVYRTGRYQYQNDFYNEFIIPPAVMITQDTQNYLSQSGLFERVVPAGSGTAAKYRLTGNILELYGDMRNKSRRQAVVTIALFFTAAQPPEKLLLAKTYRKQCPLRGIDANGLVGAYETCLDEILRAFDADVRAALASQNERSNIKQSQSKRSNSSE